MTQLPVRFTLAAVAIAATGCAQQPSKSAPNAPAANNYAKPASAASMQEAAYGVSPHVLDLARNEGYRPMVLNGNTIFCRKQTPIGSNLPVTHCVDTVNLRFEVLQEEQQRQQLNQPAPMVNQPQ